MVLSGVSEKLDQNDGEFSYRFGDIFVVFKESVDHLGGQIWGVSEFPLRLPLRSLRCASVVLVLYGVSTAEPQRPQRKTQIKTPQKR